MYKRPDSGSDGLNRLWQRICWHARPSRFVNRETASGHHPCPEAVSCMRLAVDGKTTEAALAKPRLYGT